jgi:hypothetical protein
MGTCVTAPAIRKSNASAVFHTIPGPILISIISVMLLQQATGKITCKKYFKAVTRLAIIFVPGALL